MLRDKAQKWRRAVDKLESERNATLLEMRKGRFVGRKICASSAVISHFGPFNSAQTTKGAERIAGMNGFLCRFEVQWMISLFYVVDKKEKKVE